MTDKLVQHYGQQLSELIDGELAPDQARFLLRRLQHDDELKGCLERWQLCGDVLRGQATHAAPVDFAARVAAAVAQEAVAPAGRQAGRGGRGLLRWGGGALAASVALIALLVARQVPDAPGAAPAGTETLAAVDPAPAAPAVATVADASDSQPIDLPANDSSPYGPSAQAASSAAAAGLAVASVAPRQARGERRGSATRTQQVARAAQQRADAPQLATANAPVALPSLHRLSTEEAIAKRDPFLGGMGEPAARPWPRSVLPQYANSPYAASYGGGSAGFYPFEPQLRQAPATSASAPAADATP
ncbi:sigma-E factor negative regulatory protein [Pseudoxanthomonas composti]|uniref:Anti sigma-E protein RseA N-terminal domain-containing protein n=1 Tax=Pseudoxanthomonas composti TaxID=2137479 RepID=A0A4Q1JRL6_9GAMM|nr:sigma-E factor negative regulatory protein [Pseudoxanthomonas composti]RXR00930.1 hypothetical protein EPA99_16745 [Pseudoxanthomonas composti]